MSVNLKKLVLGLCGAALMLTLVARTASADSVLNVIPPSNVSLTISLGLFVDDEGGTTVPGSDPAVGYGPGDINPNTGNPVSFVSFGDSVGQANPSALPFLPGGVVPVLGDGSSTTLNGTVTVNSIGFSISSAAIGADQSGLWQPGTVSPGDAAGPPAPGELGIFIDASGIIPGEIVVATLNNTLLSLDSANAALSGGNQGNFSGPGTLTLVNALINGFAAGPLATAINSPVTNESTSTTVAGNFSLLGNIGTLTLPFSSVLYASTNGLWAQIEQSGTIYATGLVPEPSTFVMAMSGMAGMGWYGVRRRNRRAR